MDLVSYFQGLDATYESTCCPYRNLSLFLVGWLAGWLVGWLVGRLAGWLGRLGRLAGLAGLGWAGSRAGWLAGLDGCWPDAWKLETLFLDSHTLDALKGSADSNASVSILAHVQEDQASLSTVFHSPFASRLLSITTLTVTSMSQHDLYMLAQDRLSTGGNFVLCDAWADRCPIRYASSGFEDLFGYSKSECLGKNCGDLIGKPAILARDPGLTRLAEASLLAPKHVAAALDAQALRLGKQVQELLAYPWQLIVVHKICGNIHGSSK